MRSCACVYVCMCLCVTFLPFGLSSTYHWLHMYECICKLKPLFISHTTIHILADTEPKVPCLALTHSCDQSLPASPVVDKLHPPLLCRAEMQRVLADVTRHMEQQYLAQKSLEKLRADNETLALRQKDRKVGLCCSVPLSGGLSLLYWYGHMYV